MTQTKKVTKKKAKVTTTNWYTKQSQKIAAITAYAQKLEARQDMFVDTLLDISQGKGLKSEGGPTTNTPIEQVKRLAASKLKELVRNRTVSQ